MNVKYFWRSWCNKSTLLLGVKLGMLCLAVVVLYTACISLSFQALSSPFRVEVLQAEPVTSLWALVWFAVATFSVLVLLLHHKSFVLLGRRIGFTSGSLFLNEKQAVEKLCLAFGEMVHAIEGRDKVLRRDYRRATSANVAKSDFLLNISHELRTPMHAIMNFAEIGRKKVECHEDEKLKIYFQRIEESGERLLVIINSILDLVSLEMGRINFCFVENNMREVVDDAVSQLMSLMEKKNIRIEVVQTVTKVNWVFDRARIVQVIVNLLSNAIKFSPENRAIVVAISRASIEYENKRSRPCILVSVKDQGMGIPKIEQESIFEKFQQSSKNNSQHGGNGIGLAVCREIIQAHQGKIWAEDNIPKGATFTFAIPIIPKTK